MLFERMDSDWLKIVMWLKHQIRVLRYLQPLQHWYSTLKLCFWLWLQNLALKHTREWWKWLLCHEYYNRSTKKSCVTCSWSSKIPETKKAMEAKMPPAMIRWRGLERKLILRSFGNIFKHEFGYILPTYFPMRWLEMTIASKYINSWKD